MPALEQRDQHLESTTEHQRIPQRIHSQRILEYHQRILEEHQEASESTQEPERAPESTRVKIDTEAPESTNYPDKNPQSSV
jgi:hypothetical protein